MTYKLCKRLIALGKMTVHMLDVYFAAGRLTDEEYEDYKNGPASENRYPARDFYEMAFEEIHSDTVQYQLAQKIVEKIISHIKPM